MESQVGAKGQLCLYFQHLSPRELVSRLQAQEVKEKLAADSQGSILSGYHCSDDNAFVYQNDHGLTLMQCVAEEPWRTLPAGIPRDNLVAIGLVDIHFTVQPEPGFYSIRNGQVIAMSVNRVDISDKGGLTFLRTPTVQWNIYSEQASLDGIFEMYEMLEKGLAGSALVSVGIQAKITNHLKEDGQLERKFS